MFQSYETLEPLYGKNLADVTYPFGELAVFEIFTDKVAASYHTYVFDLGDIHPLLAPHTLPISVHISGIIPEGEKPRVSYRLRSGEKV